MITPRFSCSQNDRSVIVSAYCPAVRASEIEIHVDDTLLSLHVAPYFLRLSFPASVVEDDQSSAVYDPASGYLTLTLTKLNREENFPDLDLLGKLLAPPPAQSTPRNATIEVLSSQDTSENTVTSDPGDTERNEILDGEHRHIFRVLPLIMTNLSSICSCSQLVDNSPDCTRPTPSIGNIPSETLWVPQRIYWVFSSRRHYGERDQRTRRGCRIRRLRHEESKWDPEYYMYVVPPT
jgi:protein SHQ1